MRYLAPLALATTLALACGGGGNADDASTTASSSGEGDGEAGSNAESSAGESATTDTGETTGSTPCANDWDCDTDGELCVDGVCEPCNRCSIASYSPIAEPTRLVMVLDRSTDAGARVWDHDDLAATPERPLLEVVRDAIFEWEDFTAQNIEFELVLAPGETACEDCYEPSACLLDAGSVVPTSPDDIPTAGRGASPIAAALTRAHALAPDDNIPRHGVIWLAASVPNCQAGSTCASGDGCPLLENVDDSLADTLAAWAADGDATAVVAVAPATASAGEAPDDGLAAADFSALLQELAAAGGAGASASEAFFPGETQSDLVDAIANAGGQFTSCRYDLEEPPNMPLLPEQLDFVDMDVEGVVMPRLSQTECESGTQNGFHWIEPGLRVELCGPACLDAKRGQEVSINVYPSNVPACWCDERARGRYGGE